MIEFQSAHPVRGATFFGFRILPAPLFQSTRPVWGATASHLTRRSSRRISIHAPRVGRDGQHCDYLCCGHNISIHAPRVGRDATDHGSEYKKLIFQSTRPVWGATRCGLRSTRTNWISIHAPRVGRDRHLDCRRLLRQISIHAPRVGRDLAFTFRQHEIP